MRILFIIFFITTFSLCSCAQGVKLTSVISTDSAGIKEEIRNLIVQLNEAAKKHDRHALEKIYADEFLFIHGVGYIDNKTEHIRGIMETDSVGGLPLPTLDNLLVYGNMVVYRNPFRGPGGTLYLGTNIYAKRNGSWQIIQVQGTAQQSERKWVKTDRAILDSYTGRYQQENGAAITISRTEDTLVLRITTQPPRRFLAVSESQFFDKMGTMISFYKENGRVTHVIRRFPNGSESKWLKKEE
jgi:hypothetical protein